MDKPTLQSFSEFLAHLGLNAHKLYNIGSILDNMCMHHIIFIYYSDHDIMKTYYIEYLPLIINSLKKQNNFKKNICFTEVILNSQKLIQVSVWTRNESTHANTITCLLIKYSVLTIILLLQFDCRVFRWDISYYI